MSTVKLIRPRRFDDGRGWFTESFTAWKYARLGVDMDFVQDNHSFSRDAGTLRGLHFQLPPKAQDKLVRCVRGRIWDVAVDLRRGSPSYGRWVGVELSAESGLQLFIPIGFAHGFITLEPDTEVEYKVSAPYAPEADAGVIWNDPQLAVDWPLQGGEPVLSAKDARLPPLAQFQSPFAYNGVPLSPLDPEPLIP